MKVKELIDKLIKLNPEGTLWISDQQGGGGEMNSPYQLTHPDEFYSGEVAQIGDVVVSYENT